jgi:hypothetical protein
MLSTAAAEEATVTLEALVETAEVLSMAEVLAEVGPMTLGPLVVAEVCGVRIPQVVEVRRGPAVAQAATGHPVNLAVGTAAEAVLVRLVAAQEAQAEPVAHLAGAEEAEEPQQVALVAQAEQEPEAR